MIKLIKKYNNLSFEEKTAYSALFSLVSNTFLATFKIILSIYKGIFFFVSGLINIFVIISKLMCYFGIQDEKKRKIKGRNTSIGMFIILMGIQYGIYMGRLIYSDVETMTYGMRLAIAIACVSFVEMGIVVKGLFKSYGKGHYFRNIKLINFCSAMTALVLTGVAIMSFVGVENARIANGLFGLIVGIIIVLIGIYVIIIPRFSILGREEQNFVNVNQSIEQVHIQLTNSKIYGNYYYDGIREGEYVVGRIYQEKSPIRKWNIHIKILIIILSEILIFPYMMGSIINSFKGNYIIKKLNNQMEEYNGRNINNISTYLT